MMTELTLEIMELTRLTKLTRKAASLASFHLPVNMGPPTTTSGIFARENEAIASAGRKIARCDAS